MHRIKILLCFLFVLTISLSAQDTTPTPEPLPPAPMVFFGREMFLLEEGSPRPRPWPDCGLGQGLRLSPNGEWIAGSSQKDGVRLCNIYTLEVIDVEAPLHIPANPFPSFPSWSPDGTQVAWSVSDQTSQHILMSYDLDSEEAQVLVEDVPVAGARPQVLWGQSGILVVIDDAEPIAPLYSPEGELLAEDLSNGIFFSMYAWVTDSEGTELLARYQNYAQGDVIDPLTGQTWFPRGIEAYSLLAPDGLSLAFNRETGGTDVHFPDGESFDLGDLSPALQRFVPVFQFDARNISIAPDGEAFAIFDLDELIWRDGETSDVPDTIPGGDGTGVLWGPVGYRIQGELLSPIG